MVAPPILTRRRRLWALIGANALGATTSWNLVNMGAAADVMARHYDVPLPTIGLFTTVLFGAQILLQVPGGRLADRLGARRVALSCLVVIMVANVISAATPSLAAALTLRSFVGMAVGIAFVAGSAYIRATGGSALAQGIYGGASLGGAGLAIASIPAMIGWLDWRTPFLSGAVVAALGVVLLVSSPTVAVPVVERRPRLWQVVTDRRVLQFGLPQAASFGTAIVLGNWIVPLLTRHGGYPEAVAGATGSLILLGGIVGRPAGGLLAKWRPQWSRSLVLGSMLTGGLATAMLTLGQPLPLVVCGSLLVGVAAGIPFGSLFNAVSTLRPDSPAAAIGVMNLPALLTMSLGTPLVGLTFGGATGGRLGFFIAATLWAATAIVLPSHALFVASQQPNRDAERTPA